MIHLVHAERQRAAEGVAEEIVQLSAERGKAVKRGKKSLRTLENERRQVRLYEIMEELRSLTERRRA